MHLYANDLPQGQNATKYRTFYKIVSMNVSFINKRCDNDSDNAMSRGRGRGELRGSSRAFVNASQSQLKSGRAAARAHGSVRSSTFTAYYLYEGTPPPDGHKSTCIRQNRTLLPTSTTYCTCRSNSDFTLHMDHFLRQGNKLT